MYFTDPVPGWTRHLARGRERLKPSGRPAQVSQHPLQLVTRFHPQNTHRRLFRHNTGSQRPFPSTTTTPGHTRLPGRDTLSLFPPDKSHLSPSSSTTDRGPGALQKKATARGRPTTDRHRWLARSLARSLVRPPRRLHLLWRDSVRPRSRPEVARAHNRTGNSPVGSPTPPQPTREHGERGPGWTFGATKTKVRPRPQAARKTGENDRSLARSLAHGKQRSVTGLGGPGASATIRAW